MATTGGCSGGPNGSTTGGASAGFGHVGVAAGTFSTNPQPIDYFTEASYIDTVTFTSINPTDTQAVVSLNLFLEGVLRTFGISQPRLEGSGYFGSTAFVFGLQQIPGAETFVSGLNLVSGTLNNSAGFTSALLRTPTVIVPLGTPVEFKLALRAQSFAREPGSLGTVDFLNTFEVPVGSDAFVLPAGVTANSGTWLINNRRVDPNAGAVPEPATWALMIGGFGMAGAVLRRRRTLAAP